VLPWVQVWVVPFWNFYLLFEHENSKRKIASVGVEPSRVFHYKRGHVYNVLIKIFWNVFKVLFPFTRDMSCYIDILDWRVSRCSTCVVSDTDIKPILMIPLNYVIFLKFYWCWHICVRVSVVSRYTCACLCFVGYELLYK